jgi:hypothetical protein
MTTITTKQFFLASLLLTFVLMVLPRYQQHFISTSQASKPTDVVAQLSDREFECLAKNVYFEAGNQPVVGQLAVALVTLNRVNDHRFPRTICGVISQGSMDDPNKKVGRSCQFSWYCNGKSNNPNKNSVTWQTAKQVAHGITCNASTTFTRIYGVATNPVAPYSYIPLPYVGVPGGSIELNVDGMNINIITTDDKTAYTRCYVVVEYLLY